MHWTDRVQPTSFLHCMTKELMTSRVRIMILKVKHLEMVRAIHEEGTLTGAARRLFISQPALSRRLAKLERRIGAELFRRHQKGMALTREGQRVLDSAGRVLGELERVEHDVQLLADGYMGTVRIATECYMCYHWLPWIARHFSERFPRVELLLVPEVTRDPYGALTQGSVDVGIVYSSPPVGSDLSLVEIFHDEMVAVVAAGHPLAQRTYLTAEDFQGETLICHYDEPDRSVVEKCLLEPAGIRAQRTMEMMVTPAVMEMTKAGYGIAVLPRWILGPEWSSGETVVRPLTEEGLWRSWSAAIQADRSDEATLVALLEVLESDMVKRTGAAYRKGDNGPGDVKSA